MKKILLTVVGDISPANLPYNIGLGVASSFNKHQGAIWEKSINNIFKDSDIVFGNLESPLIYDEYYADNNSFAGTISFAVFLKKHRINIVSIANNHILEQGPKGFDSTCRILSKNNIKHIGKNENGLSNIEVVNINNVSIGFCGFNAIHDISNPELYAELTEQNIFKTIEELNKIGLDYTVISLHWGNEYIHYPSQSQIKLAHKIIDSGVDIIVGHHPHVIQPVEEYKKGLIFYSLGNFIFDMQWSDKVRKGLVGKVTLYDNKMIKYELKGIKVSNDYAPYINDDALKLAQKVNNRFDDILKQIDKSTKNYSKRYGLKSILNRFYERILMKVYILKNYRKLSNRSKKRLILNIKSKMKIVK